MSRFRRFEIVEPSPSYFLKETSIFNPPRTLLLNPCFPSFPIVEHELDYTLDLLNFTPEPPVFFDEFETITDLIQIDESPFHTSTRRLIKRRSSLTTELYLQKLCDRVSALETGFDRLVREEKIRKKQIGDRKYTYTAEIKTPEKDRKYKLTAEKKGTEKSYKWTAEIKGKEGEDSPIEQTCTIKVSSGDSSSKSEEKKKKWEKVKGKGKSVGSIARVVEIEEPSDHGAIVLRQVGVNFLLL